MKTTRCPTCGSPVASIFDHVDLSCNSDDAAAAEQAGLPYNPPAEDDPSEGFEKA